MTLRYAVGIKIGNKADQVTVEAEDALIAALKVKTAHPEAAITYVRNKSPRRSTPSTRQPDRYESDRALRRRGSVTVFSPVGLRHDHRDHARARAQGSGPAAR